MTQRITIAAGLTVVLTAAAITFVHLPLWQAARDAKTNLGFAIRSKALTDQRPIGDDQDRFSTLTAQNKQLEKLVISNTSSVDFFTSIESTADRNHVHVTTRFLTEPKAGVLQRTTLELTTSGPFPDVLSFLAELQQLPTLMVFDTIALQNQAPSGNVQATVTLSTVWQ